MIILPLIDKLLFIVAASSTYNVESIVAAFDTFTVEYRVVVPDTSNEFLTDVGL